MQKQITTKQSWLQVETSVGTEFVPVSDTGLYVRDSHTQTHHLTDNERSTIIARISPYCEGTPQQWETIMGYGARLSAPGYLDCTEWTVFDSIAEAEAYLEEMYGDDEQGGR